MILSRIFWTYLAVALAVWITVMIGYELLHNDEQFYSGIFFNLIYGIPLSIVTSIFSSWMYSHYILRKRESDASNFYQKFVGNYQEYKIVPGKKPEVEWLAMEITRSDLKLRVDFKTRVYKPMILSAQLELFGDLEKKRCFELFYNQESANGYDEGYWGKYDIQLMDNGEVIGHKYHTASKANSEGRIDYIITKVKWVKVNNADTDFEKSIT